MVHTPADGSQPRVLVVGEALVDVRIDDRVGTGAAPVEHPGGSPLNIAVGLARLGVGTTLAAQLGADERGAAIGRHLTASGVDLVALAPQRPTSTATARVRPDGSADYAFDVHWDPRRLPDPAGYALVHVGSIGAVLAPGADRVAELVAAARAAGIPVSLDPNVRPAVTPDLDEVRRQVDRLSRVATVVKLSDEDADVLHPDVPAERLVAHLTGAGGARLAVLTRGADGLLLSAGAGAAAVAAPAVPVVDTIGAGDTVMSALLAGALRQGLLPVAGGPRAAATATELEWLGRLAVRAAAITCSRPGADPPWRDELPELDAPRPTDG